MPLEGIDEDGLPKNPDLQLMQWRFLLTAETTGVDKDAIWESLLQAIKENGKAGDLLYCTHTSYLLLLLSPDMAPFYVSLCAEIGRPVDSDLLAGLKAANKEKLAALEEAIEDSEKNFGETEQKEALQAKAEYLCRIGNKVQCMECPNRGLLTDQPITGCCRECISCSI